MQYKAAAFQTYALALAGGARLDLTSTQHGHTARPADGTHLGNVRSHIAAKVQACTAVSAL